MSIPGAIGPWARCRKQTLVNIMKGHNLAYEDGSSVDSKQSIDTLSWVVRDYMKKGNKLKGAELASILSELGKATTGSVDGQTTLLLDHSKKIKTTIDAYDQKKWYNKAERDSKEGAATKAKNAKKALAVKKDMEKAKEKEKEKAKKEKEKAAKEKAKAKDKAQKDKAKNKAKEKAQKDKAKDKVAREKLAQKKKQTAFLKKLGGATGNKRKKSGVAGPGKKSKTGPMRARKSAPVAMHRAPNAPARTIENGALYCGPH